MRKDVVSLAICGVILSAAACGRKDAGSSTAPAGTPAAPATTEASPVAGPPMSAFPAIDPEAVLQHIKVLSSNKFEGRKPGTRGEELTVAYLETQFRDLGLQPGNPDGTYVQKVPLVGITAAETRPLIFVKGAQTLGFKWRDDVVAWTKHVADTASISRSESSSSATVSSRPEYNWDDFKGMDVKGKTMVMLVNDPPVPDPANPSELDPKIFGGKAMTYYGRWTYKYEDGARKGAAAVLIVHETDPAGYPFNVVQGNPGEQFDLVTPDKNMGRAEHRRLDHARTPRASSSAWPARTSTR